LDSPSLLTIYAIISAVKTILAVDVGGTQIRVAVYPELGTEPIQQKRITTCGEGSAVERLIGLVRELWPTGHEVLAISVGAPGQVDPDEGMIIAAPNIAGWTNLYLKRKLEEYFLVPVFLNNDANLGALGEWKFGAAQGHQNVFYITISTGIGGGVILDNHLLLGQRGLATEVGHVVIMPDGPRCGCGKQGHLEAFASGTAIANYYNQERDKGRQAALPALPRPSAKEIGIAAQNGDSLALEAFWRAGHYMGIGMANYLHLFNPSIIVIGGGVSRIGEIYWKPMREAMEEQVLSKDYIRDLAIVPAALGDNCGLLGALALAQSALK
jgi:glucokinase